MLPLETGVNVGKILGHRGKSMCASDWDPFEIGQGGQKRSRGIKAHSSKVALNLYQIDYIGFPRVSLPS